MEHSRLSDIFRDNGLIIDAPKEQLLIKYGELILAANKNYNLTGFKTIEDIIAHLIIGSIEPLTDLDVPRGTVFADIGSGAGIPGIPLAVYHEAWKGTLIESNRKKVSFISMVLKECRIENAQVFHGRAEDAGRADMRESCDMVFSRALGDLYIVMEIGAPLLKQGGLLYVYSHEQPGDLSRSLTEHSNNCSLSIIDRGRYNELGIKDTGLLFCKDAPTGVTSPRKMSVIKRELRRLKVANR